MIIRLIEIPVQDYEYEKVGMLGLVETLWEDPESAANAMHSIERWGNSQTESGGYFYILDQYDEVIGLTGFFKIPYAGYYGLRHHGTRIKGTGRAALDVLVEYMKSQHPDFQSLVELMPDGRDDLIEKFSEWGFEKVENPDLSWEPKREYYRVMMVRGV